MFNIFLQKFFTGASAILFASCGIASINIDIPSIAAYLYVLLFVSGVAINILGAATVELYPTNLRWAQYISSNKTKLYEYNCLSRAMAICISLMVGRFGSVVGSNITGILLESHCNFTFYIACSTLVGCGFLALLIPKTKVEDRVENENLP